MVQDDSLSASWIDPESLAMERVVLMDWWRLPKREKADFEAVFEARDGALFVLGSGGTGSGGRAFDDVATGEARTIDATALHEALGRGSRAAEHRRGGAAERRGDGAAPSSREREQRTARLSAPPAGRRDGKRQGTVPGARGAFATRCLGSQPFFDVALASIEAERAILADGGCDSGTVMGVNGGAVALTFTDATLLGGRVLYLAAAEDCGGDAIADGPVVGAAIWVMEGAGGGRYALLTESDGSPSCRKIEGIALHPGGREAFVVTDRDDEGQASELCTVALEGPW